MIQMYKKDLSQERSWNVRVAQHRLHRILQSLVPVTSYLYATEVLCGTDIGSHVAYIRDLRNVERLFQEWQEKKLQQHPGRDFSYIHGQGALDIGGLPELRFEGKPLAVSVGRLTLPLTCQIVLGFLLAMGAQFAFQRLDVR